jgi:transposase-like protein
MKKLAKKNKGRKIGRYELERIAAEVDFAREARLQMIQQLIPLGLSAIEEELQGEILELAGPRYSRGGSLKRWGANPGSVFVGDQKLKVNVPRVRDVVRDQEVSLSSYERLQSPGTVDEAAFRRVISGISTGRYEQAAESVPETFGISKSSISRKFIRASAKRLEEFLSRDLSAFDIVAVFIDGKHFQEHEMVTALGITLEGEKILLGFVETSTENHKVCKEFLLSLKSRGLKLDEEMLFIVDGGKGLRKGITEAAGEKAVVARCQWHKRENVVSYLSKERQSEFRGRLQAAYEEETYDAAKSALLAIRRDLARLNQSAAASLDEGFEETLTLHKLGLFSKLGRSFKTTNCIEGVHKQLARFTDRVDRWQNSDQRRRWVASAYLEIEPGLNRVQGHEHLKELRKAMRKLLAKQKQGKAA